MPPSIYRLGTRHELHLIVAGDTVAAGPHSAEVSATGGCTSVSCAGPSHTVTVDLFVNILAYPAHPAARMASDVIESLARAAEAMRSGGRSRGGVSEQGRRVDHTHKREAADGPCCREHDLSTSRKG